MISKPVGTRLSLVCGLLTALTCGVYAQPVPTDAVERSFDRIKNTLKLERFQADRESIPGASRRFEYLYYLDSASKLVKIRMIERENEPNTSLKVDDYFFVDGDLRRVRLYFFMDSSKLDALRKGSIVPLLTGRAHRDERGKTGPMECLR